MSYWAYLIVALVFAVAGIYFGYQWASSVSPISSCANALSNGVNSIVNATCKQFKIVDAQNSVVADFKGC
jgi:hypothetical protein